MEMAAESARTIVKIGTTGKVNEANQGRGQIAARGG
jgi:hypothetical protein